MGKKPQTVRLVIFQLSAALCKFFREMWLFFLVHLYYVQLHTEMRLVIVIF